MENVSIFDLMSDEEANKFKPEETKKPQLTGACSSEVQHQREKGLQGEYAEGWEEAIEKDNPEGPNITASKTASAEQKKSAKVDKTASYLSYRKLFCYAGKQHLIEDPTLSLDAIRKKFEKVYPELSKERTEMIYQPPIIPKPPKSKNDDEKTPNLDFDVKEEIKVITEGKENAAETEKSESEGVKLLPSVVNGKELMGLVIPVLKGSRKGAGEEELEKTFTSWKDLLANQAVRNLLIARDGTYEVRITQIGLFCAKVGERAIPNGDIAYDGFELYVPKVPYHLLMETITLFKELSTLKGVKPVEVLVRFYYDGENHFLWVPHQVVWGKETQVLNEAQDQMIDQQNIRVLEMHSHNIMSAFFSPQDNKDEIPTGIYAVVGKAHQRVPQISARFSCGGNYREINYTDVFDMPKNSCLIAPLKESVLEKWKDRIQIRKDVEVNEFSIGTDFLNHR